MLGTKLIKFCYTHFTKPILFRMDPEDVHDHFTRVGSVLGKLYLARKIARIFFHYKNPRLEQTLHGIIFRNPVGLSAGFDKDGNLSTILPDVGFGYMQLGSVTHKAYEGNPKPRLHRLKKSKGIVVYYGLKNIGIFKILRKLKNKKRRFPISFSVAKTNSRGAATTKLAIKDYISSLKAIKKSKLADLYTINISCPNAFGGEPFTSPEKLSKLLTAIDKLSLTAPIFIKMPINLAWQEFKSLLQVIIKHNVNGVIIGNLNKNHQHKTIKDPIPKSMEGGISGKPCEQLSNNLIEKSYKAYGKKLTIIGVGGIFSAEDAYKKIQLGASLVQLITGMIFEGPQLIGSINKGIVQLMKEDGFSSIKEAIGTKAL